MKEETPGILHMEIGGPRLNEKAFTVMCSQFAIILKSGIPISRTVNLIADKTADKALKKMLAQVAEDVEAGRSLAASFAERGNKLLPPTFIESIRAGEESGNVDRSFESMYLHFDKQTKLQGQVRGAMAYPVFVLALAFVVVAVLMAVAVPRFTQMFESYGSELPLMTRMLIGISNFFKNYSLTLVAFISIAILAGKLYGNTETGRLRFARWSLRLPILGNISQLSAASQFANSMATMLGSGLPLPKALSITARVLDNYYISQEVGKCTAKVEEGRSLATSLRDAECLPDILVDMVGVGEETGEMENTLSTIGAYYDSELEMAISAALKKLEPTLLIGIAVIAGFIVISIYMAMISLYGIM